MQVRQLLEKNDKGYIVATCRNPSGATGLLKLKNEFPERLDIHPLDLTVESTMEVYFSSYVFVQILLSPFCS